MKSLLRSIGPAIIVAAVVLGPGSILTSSKVGATFGAWALPVTALSVVLMIAMVALSARLGVVYERSLCRELAARLGEPAALSVALILFLLIALFQSSNNVALVAGLEPILGEGPLPTAVRLGLLLAVNLLIIVSLYFLRDLYRSVEHLMKILIGLMTFAFLANFLVVLASPRGYQPQVPAEAPDWIPLLGMIGTTFSVAGAFYQAYLVREKGWGLQDLQKSLSDSILSIAVLGLVTAIILLTAWRVFYGQPDPVQLGSVGDVARQLEPLLGPAAKNIFCLGILAGALSSFLVNAMIGGTVLSDGLGKGARLEDRWPVHFTTAALLTGMIVGMASLASAGSTVHLITLAQALTVLGIPALAAALIYLATRPDLQGERRIPPVLIAFAVLGLIVACVLALLTARTVIGKWTA